MEHTEKVGKSLDCRSGKKSKHTELPQRSELHRYAKAILLGVLIGEILTMGMLFLFSIIMCKMEIPLIAVDVLVVFAAVLGAFGAGYICGRLLREKGLMMGLVCGGVILVIMLLFNVGFHQPTTVAYLCVKVAAILLGAALGGILGVNRICRKKRIKY